MSRKFECPSCKSHTSAIYDVFEGEREACPNCGLSGDVMREIHRVRETHANEELKGQVERWMVRAGKAEAERDAARSKLARIRGYFAHFNWDEMDCDYDD